MTLGDVIEVLEKSVDKHGDKPLTTGHLLNILKLARKMRRKRDEDHELYLERIAFEIEHEDAGCRD